MSKCAWVCKSGRNAGRHKTLSDSLSRLSRLGLKKSGQRNPNRYALSRLSRLVPTVFNMNRLEKWRRGVCDMAGRELNSRHKTGDMQWLHAGTFHS